MGGVKNPYLDFMTVPLAPYKKHLEFRYLNLVEV